MGLATTFPELMAEPTSEKVFLAEINPAEELATGLAREIEDFPAYNETDVPGKVTVVANEIILIDGDRDEDYYVTYDYGIGYFTDFVHWVDVNVTALTNNAASAIWIYALSNADDDLFDIEGSAGDYLTVYCVRKDATHYTINIGLSDAGVQILLDTSVAISVGTPSYLAISRSGTAFTCEIYSTAVLRVAGGAGDVDTITGIAINTTFQFVYGLASRNNAGAGRDITGIVSNLWLGGYHSIGFDEAEQDYNVFNETDVPGKVNIQEHRIVLLDGDRDEDYYITYDYGANYFGDFLHWVDVNVIKHANDNRCGFACWALSNADDDLQDIGGDAIFVWAARNAIAHYQLMLIEIDTGVLTTLDTSVAIALGSPSYLAISRVGTAFNCEIYSTAALRAAGAAGDVDTIAGVSINTTFQWIYGLSSYSDVIAGQDITGIMSNLWLGNTYEINYLNETVQLADDSTENIRKEILQVQEDGAVLTEKISIAQVEANAGTYWHDMVRGVFYVHMTGSDDPDDHILIGFFWLYFATKGIILGLLKLKNFTLFTEWDPGADIVIDSATQITVTTLAKNVDAYVYYDFTAGFFNEDFEHRVDIKCTVGAALSTMYVWMLANMVDDGFGIRGATGDYLAVFLHIVGGLPTIYLDECDGGGVTQDSYTGAFNTDYYLTIKRDESVGIFGTIYCYIYSDEKRTTLLDTLSITLSTSKKDFRYLYAVNSFNTGVAAAISGVVSNLEISHNTFFEPYIGKRGIPNLNQSNPNLYWGVSQISGGDLILLNNRGFFDQISKRFVWIGKETIIKLGGDLLTYGEYKKLYTGQIIDKSFSRKDFIVFQ